MSEEEQLLRQLEESIQGAGASLQENIYRCAASYCSLLNAYRKYGRQPGWTSKLATEDSLQAFQPSEQKGIEEAFRRASPWLDVVLGVEAAPAAQPQRGGAAGSKMPLQPGGRIFEQGASLTGDDVSIDKVFYGAMKKIDEIDLAWNTFARETPGIYKLMTSADLTIPPTPITPFPIPVPGKLIHTFLTAILEIVRSMMALSPIDFALGRYLTTLLALLNDMVAGNWRQMILTSLGFYSQNGVLAGVIGRLFLGAWLMINPVLRTRLSADVYQSGKSMFIGFLLWAATVFTPSTIKEVIEAQLSRIRLIVEDVESKAQALLQPADAAVRPFGFKVALNLDLETLKHITVEDLQNIQSLIYWKQFICAKEAQDLVEPLLEDPIFRLVVELLGIPTQEEEKVRLCGDTLGKPLAEQFKDAVQLVPVSNDPVESPSPIVLKGGGRRVKAGEKRGRSTATRRRLGLRSRRG
jgi:hypothetical protein